MDIGLSIAGLMLMSVLILAGGLFVQRQVLRSGARNLACIIFVGVVLDVISLTSL
jgi:putative effector of murein hydrolase